MAEKKVIELEVKTNAQSLKAQLKEAQQEVQTLSEKFGITSKEATEAAKKAAQLKDAIGDAKALTDAFNPDAKFNALSTSISGVLNGFQAFEGALGLVGVEGEAVQKTLLKVQSAMALSEGINGIMAAKDSFVNLGNVIKTTLVSAFSSLKAAIITTGIGALVIAIGLLLPKILEWADFTGRAKKKQDELNASLEDHQKALRKDREELKKDLDFKIRLAEAEGKSGSELLKLKESNANKTNAQIYKEIESARARLKALREVDLGVMASSKEEYNELVKKNIAKRKEVVKEISDLKGEIKAGNQDLLVERTKFETESTKIAEKGNKDRAKTDADKEAKAKKKREDDLKALDDLEGDMRASGKKRNDRQAEELSKATEDRLAILTKGMNDEIELDNRILKNKEENAKIEKQIKNAQFDIARNTFSAIGDLAKSFAGKSEREQKRAFNIQKAANIAGAVMDTYKAANGAYASMSGIPYVGPFLGAAAAGVAIAAGIANVNNISKQQFGGGANTSSAPSSTGSLGGGGSNNQAITPNFNIIGNQNQTQLAQLNQAPVKAYVVGSDVTTQQMLDKKKIQNATI
jgi:hypothetical protein